ncbi:MAG: septal ring lytic transglycosylase RlpA family protein [Kangiellaceae bacterium]|nr:septal ring lytic transglycosylase RlpA family protein [Kangiellaceae bacterium]
MPEEQDAAPKGQFEWAKVKPIKPKYEPRSRYGNPSSYEQDGKTYRVLASAENYKQRGIASWYGTKFHGRRTSSGESYDMFKLTAAHKTLPLPTYAKVTNLENGKQITVKINDRGPFKKGRIIDLSYAAAHKLGMAKQGTARVEVETLTFSPNSSGRFSASAASSSGVDESQPLDYEISQGKSRYVQVGAYSVHKTAQKLAKVLDREIRLPVKITSIKRNGKRLYRVRIGPVPTESLAHELISTLSIDELGTPKVVYE